MVGRGRVIESSGAERRSVLYFEQSKPSSRPFPPVFPSFRHSAISPATPNLNKGKNVRGTICLSQLASIADIVSIWIPSGTATIL